MPVFYPLVDGVLILSKAQLLSRSVDYQRLRNVAVSERVLDFRQNDALRRWKLSVHDTCLFDLLLG